MNTSRLKSSQESSILRGAVAQASTGILMLCDPTAGNRLGRPQTLLEDDLGA